MHLLALSFHKPGVLLNEDILFRYHAEQQGFVQGESMAKAGAYPSSIKKRSGSSYSGLSGASVSVGADTASLTSLFHVGRNAWNRDGFKPKPPKKSAFETWMNKVFDTPANCLVLGGHHSTVQSNDGKIFPALWGDEDRGDSPRWFTALVPTEGTDGAGNFYPELNIYGHDRGKSKAILRAGPFNMRKALAECRLIVIYGCRGSHGFTASQWQNWVALASDDPSQESAKPLVLGWWEGHFMPRDKHGEHVGEAFWTKMKALSVANSNADLKKLCTDKTLREQVIQIWGQALKETYGKKEKCQRHLWYDKPYRGNPCKKTWKASGGGAFDQSKQEWRVLSAAGPIKKFSE